MLSKFQHYQKSVYHIKKAIEQNEKALKHLQFSVDNNAPKRGPKKGYKNKK